MKSEKSKKTRQVLLQCVIIMAWIAMGFIFVDAKTENRAQTYDETFFAENQYDVRMSLNAIEGIDSKKIALTLPLIGSNVYAASKESSVGPFTAARSFILLSASWDESVAEGMTSVTVQIRTRNDARQLWSAWRELERLRDFRDESDVIPGHVRTEPLIVDESREFEARVMLATLDPRVTPQVTNLSFTTIGTEGGTPPLNLPLVRGRNLGGHLVPLPKKGEDGGEGVKAALNNTDDLNIISRASWASDESLRWEETGEPRWPETYGEVKAFVIHHTGGTNGGADPAATIRAIQRYHGKTLGWGDIGYNYLIAPDGRIFEGRAGGEGTVGGHTYNDKKKLGYNTGSIGIAILGNYEGRDMLTEAARQSFAKLIAAKSFEHELSPQDENRLKDIAIPVVVAHRDIDATICPGSGMTAELLRVRQLARAELESKGGLASIRRKATLLQQSDTNILIKPGQTKTVWVSYRNDGNTNWKNYLNQPVQLADASIKNRLAMLTDNTVRASFNSTSALISEKAKRDDLRESAPLVRIAQVVDDEIRPIESQTTPPNVLTFTQPNVAPGESVTIPITITVPPDAAGVLERDYVLAWGVLGYFPGTDVHIAIETTEMEWAGRLESLDTPTSTRAGVETQGLVHLRNRGVKTWLKGSIMLLLTDVAGGEPKWSVAGWPLPMGRILFDEATVKPNEVATFPLPLTAITPGLLETLFSFKYLPDVGTVPETLLETLQLPDLPGATGSFATTILPGAQAQVISHNLPSKMRPGTIKYITLKIKNVGDKPWQGGKSVYLTETASGGSASPFYHPADWISEIKPAYLWQTALKPGQTGSFAWILKAPKTKGDYTEALRLIVPEGEAAINSFPRFVFRVRVE